MTTSSKRSLCAVEVSPVRDRWGQRSSWNLALCFFILLSDPCVANKYCYDLDHSCEVWVNGGECSLAPGFMRTYCSKSCGWCRESFVIVFNSDPPDTTTFLSYVEFSSGLAQTYPDEKFSLLTHHRVENKFFVNFEYTAGSNITWDKWWSRANTSKPGSKANHLLEDSEIIYSLDVDLPGAVSVCRKKETWDKLEQYRRVAVKKCYEIFTHSQSPPKGDICTETYSKKFIVVPDLEVRADFTRGVALLQKSLFCNVSHFYFRFNSLYKEISYIDSLEPKVKQNCKAQNGLCSTGRQNKFGDYDAYFYNDEHNLYSLWSAVAKKGKSKWDWYEATNICSKLSLSLPTVNDNQQLKTLNNVFNYHQHSSSLEKFPIKLTRSPKKPGQRFVYSDKKDLRFAIWNIGEPKGAYRRKCVGQHIEKKVDNTSFGYVPTNYGWFTVGCGHKIFTHVICSNNIQRASSDLKFYHEPLQAEMIFEKGLEYHQRLQGEMIFENGLEILYNPDKSVNVATSATFKLLSCFNDCTLSKSRNKLNHEFPKATNGKDSKIYREIQHMIHICGTEEENASTLTIPLVFVCDGKADCPSASDESYCGVYGTASCSHIEWMCRSRQCVPLQARCDLIQDCQDGSDEIDCRDLCQHGMCPSGRCLPRPWFNDGQEDCDDGDDERVTEDACVFLCNRTQCVTRSMLNDSVLDCKGPEGPIDETLGALESMNCTTQRSEPLINNWAPRCILARDLFGEIIGCRYFQHLQGCENFTCPPGYVKCLRSFCIPLSYVADGKEDCYGGKDEVPSPVLYDPGVAVFQCHLSGKQMTALSAVCDGRRDCGFGEDELDCEITCLEGLVCIAGAVSAINYNKSLPLQDLTFIHDQTRYLDLSGVNVNNFFNTFPPNHLVHLQTLKLSNCRIRSITINPTGDLHGKKSVCTINSRDFQTVQTLDLSFNQINYLPQCSYLRLMSGLRHLNLSHNYQLTKLSQDLFNDYFELLTLDLSFTAIKIIDKDQFKDLSSLKTLYLQQSRLTILDTYIPASVEYFNVEGMSIEHIGKAPRKAISIKEIHSPTYKLCCPQILGHKDSKHVCNFPPGQSLSCNNLVEEAVLRSLIWLVSLSIIVGNTATLVFRLAWERQFLNKPFGLYVTNLGVSDLLMGIYLMMVGVADASFRDEYVFHDFIWRKSSTCWPAGTVATLSSLTSSLFLVLITLERYLAVRYPYGEVRLSQTTIIVAVVTVWLFGICVASLPLLPFAKNWVIYSNSGMCIGLPLESKRIPGWQFSATLFIGFNLLFFITIGVGQAAIFKTIRDKGKRIKETSNKKSQLRANQRMQEFVIAKQLSIVVLSDFMCLFPVITMGIMVILGHDVGPAAYRWTAVIVIPINSALNPLLYTLPAIQAKWSNYRADLEKAKQEARVEARRVLAQRGHYSSSAREERIHQLVIKCRRLIQLRKKLQNTEQIKKFCKESLENLSVHVTKLTKICEKLVR